MRFDGLENDITYLKYKEIRKYIIERLNDDDTELDVQYLYILIQVLKDSRDKLDKIKENKYGRTEIQDSNTEVGRCDNTCDC